jgi:protein-S-isoprenylcysteine O-methyltransferase Ste14
MKKISFWAKKNPAKAISTIILCHILLFILAIFIGNTSSNNLINISYGWVGVAGIVFVAAIFFYPHHTNKKNDIHQNYNYQKACDFAIIFSGFIMLSIGVHQLNMNKTVATSATAAAIITTNTEKKPSAKEILASGKKGNALTKQEKKILKVELKHQLKIWSKAQRKGDDTEQKNAGLIILAIIGAIGLSLILMYLVCAIACGGAEGAAIFVGIFGLAGIIWLTVFLIKRITHPRHIKKKEPANDVSPNTSV